MDVTTTAPRARVIDALTGRKAPTAFFKALSEADDQITKAALAQADVDDAAETIGLLLAENAELKRQLELARLERDAARAELGELKAEMAWGSVP